MYIVILLFLFFKGFKVPPVFHSGNTTSTITSEDFGVKVIKFGASSEITSGAVVFDGLQVRLTKDAPLNLYCCRLYEETFNCDCANRHQFIMRGQYEVKPRSNLPFFTLGDSGAGVFTVNRLNNELTCAGIAIGVIPGGNTIVTPIEAVLAALGNVKLKHFSSVLKRTHPDDFSRLDTQDDGQRVKRQK